MTYRVVKVHDYWLCTGEFAFAFGTGDSWSEAVESYEDEVEIYANFLTENERRLARGPKRELDLLRRRGVVQ